MDNDTALLFWVIILMGAHNFAQMVGFWIHTSKMLKSIESLLNKGDDEA